MGLKWNKFKKDDHIKNGTFGSLYEALSWQVIIEQISFAVGVLWCLIWRAVTDNSILQETALNPLPFLHCCLPPNITFSTPYSLWNKLIWRKISGQRPWMILTQAAGYLQALCSDVSPRANNNIKAFSRSHWQLAGNNPKPYSST